MSNVSVPTVSSRPLTVTSTSLSSSAIAVVPLIQPRRRADTAKNSLAPTTRPRKAPMVICVSFRILGLRLLHGRDAMSRTPKRRYVGLKIEAAKSVAWRFRNFVASPAEAGSQGLDPCAWVGGEGVDRNAHMTSILLVFLYQL